MTAQDAPAVAGIMQAAVLAEPGRAVVRHAPIPEPGPGQVRLKLEGCGVCASNIPPWEGREWFQYPFAPGAPGHEGWGVVDALGPDVTGVSVGERVAAITFNAYAAYDLASADALVRLPETLAGEPFPAEPLGCAVNVVRRSDFRPGQTVAVVGVGFLGALIIRMARNAGARVIALSRRPYSLEVARTAGADETIEMDDHWRVIERVKELTGGDFCDRVVEAAGKQWPLDLAAELTRERGRLIIAGYHQDGPRTVNMQLWNWRGLDVINAHERDPSVYLEGMELAVGMVSRGELDPAPLYTHRYRLSELNEAMQATRDRPEGFVKALVIL